MVVDQQSAAQHQVVGQSSDLLPLSAGKEQLFLCVSSRLPIYWPNTTGLILK